MVYFPHDVFGPRTTTLRSSSELLYHQPFTHTMHFYISFVPKTCSAWNNLLDFITHANTLFVLKSSLSNYNIRYHVSAISSLYVLGYATVSLWLLHYPVNCLCINFIEMLQQVH